MPTPVRILLLADSHLGFDLPLQPRVARRRRGPDFLANYARALEPALSGDVDLVVHAGDVFDRPSVPASLAWQALEPLRRIADRGVPVFVVPGNHERSRLPHARFAAHPLIHVFDVPRTFEVTVRGVAVSLSGFPFERRDIRTRFGDVLERTGWRTSAADVRLLCLHHCVEGATVGPADFMFTTAADVIRTADVPREFAAVLTGHVHRHQILTRDLRGRPLRTPVFYPGSIERTSLAESAETKGYMMLRLAAGDAEPLRWEFQPLPARPLILRELSVDGMSAAGVDAAVRRFIAEAPLDAVLTIRLLGDVASLGASLPSAARLRRFAPASMNIEVSGFRPFRPPPRGQRPGAAGSGENLQLEL